MRPRHFLLAENNDPPDVSNILINDNREKDKKTPQEKFSLRKARRWRV